MAGSQTRKKRNDEQRRKKKRLKKIEKRIGNQHEKEGMQ